MADRDRVLGFLEEIKPNRCCDDCLAEKAALSSRQRANQVCSTLGSQGKIVREQAYCHFCRKLKWTSAHLVASTASAAANKEGSDRKRPKPEPEGIEQGQSDPSALTPNERKAVGRISDHIQRLSSFFAQNASPAGSATPQEWFAYLAGFKDELGNINNDISLISILLAKQYLMDHLDMVPFDVALKPQGAPGLDIDERTTAGERVVAEVKTTHPFKPDDLGAQQASSFNKDAHKLAAADATHKFFFVTDRKTFEVLKKAKYKAWFEGVRVVLLPSGDEI
jgi:hypothetical protein